MTLTAKRLEVMAHELAARSDRDITAVIKQYDPESRIAIRQAIALQREAQGITLDGAAEVPGRRVGEQDGSYWLRRMNIHGPITQQELENRMASEHLEPRIRIECKIECEQRKWLAPSVGYRVTAAGDLATDQDGRPLGRMATDEARFDYAPEPLSLEMATLFNRAGLREDRTYATHEIDQAFAGSDLTTLQKMAVRHSLAMHRQVRASALDTLDERLAALRALPRQRHSLEGKSGHTIRASAAVLMDPKTGKPAVLRSRL
jgi:hypothetical protein